MKGEDKKIFNKRMSLKSALKYGFSKDDKRPTWSLLVQVEMANRAVLNHSLSAIQVILRIDNWLMKQRQEKWKRERNKENVN
jgi:hypothetical protein